MEKFIIYSKEYRQHYDRVMKYVYAIGYSPASCKTFRTSISEFLCWLEVKDITVINVTENMIKNYYDYQQERPAGNGGVLSESRIKLNMYVVRQFFQEMQDNDQIEIHPMNNLEYTTDYKRTRENLLSIDDIKKLYDVCETAKQRAMLGIIYGCGLRRQEAEKLDAKDVHFRSSMLYVREGKGGRKRTIPLSRSVVEDLKNYYYNERPQLINHAWGDASAFMLNQYGARMKGSTYSEEIKILILKANLNEQISLHHFRHAIATHLLESGMKTEYVKDFLGHMSIETTQTYTHITTTQMKKTTTYGTAAIPR
jgi:integrase/recombinase XerD